MIAIADWAPLEQWGSGQAEQSLPDSMHAIHAAEWSPDPETVDGQGQSESTSAHRTGSMTPIP